MFLSFFKQRLKIKKLNLTFTDKFCIQEPLCGLSYLCSHVYQQGKLQEFSITLFDEVEQASYKGSNSEKS